MKSIRYRKKSIQRACDAEKNADVCRRILLAIYVWTDGPERVGSGKAAPKTFRARDAKRAKRHGERARLGSGTRPEAAGRPRRVRAQLRRFGEWPKTYVSDGGGNGVCPARI